MAAPAWPRGERGSAGPGRRLPGWRPTSARPSWPWPAPR